MEVAEQKGILSYSKLPQAEYDELWDRIILPAEIKDKLLAQILLEFTVRREISSGALPIHGLIMLVGPPGTGKTSLAKAAASKASHMLKGKSPHFIQVEPHGLTSSALGRTQRDTHQLLTGTIAEYANQGPLIVLLDEVETLAVDRKRLSMDANPIDVHRATDAVLAALDKLAHQYPELLFIATSNYEGAVDEALLSRADLILEIPRPAKDACQAILADTLAVMGQKWKKLAKLKDASGFDAAAEAAAGLDGRQIRKAVLQALASSRETAIDPDKLTPKLLEHALLEAGKSAKRRKAA
jgi:AAA+ superfamily predicted ATPase